MEAGDLLIDGGNEWFPNTIRRGAELAPKGIHFMGESARACISVCTPKLSPRIPSGFFTF